MMMRHPRPIQERGRCHVDQAAKFAKTRCSNAEFTWFMKSPPELATGVSTSPRHFPSRLPITSGAKDNGMCSTCNWTNTNDTLVGQANVTPAPDLCIPPSPFIRRPRRSMRAAGPKIRRSRKTHGSRTGTQASSHTQLLATAKSPACLGPGQRPGRIGDCSTNGKTMV